MKTQHKCNNNNLSVSLVSKTPRLLPGPQPAELSVRGGGACVGREMGRMGRTGRKGILEPCHVGRARPRKDSLDTVSEVSSGEVEEEEETYLWHGNGTNNGEKLKGYSTYYSTHNLYSTKKGVQSSHRRPWSLIEAVYLSIVLAQRDTKLRG